MPVGTESSTGCSAHTRTATNHATKIALVTLRPRESRWRGTTVVTLLGLVVAFRSANGESIHSAGSAACPLTAWRTEPFAVGVFGARSRTGGVRSGLCNDPSTAPAQPFRASIGDR